MRKERKNVLAAMLLAAAILSASVPALAEGPARGVRDASSGTAWVIRILGWLGLPAQGLGSIGENSSANIDPNGEPSSVRGGTGPSASSDSSANIDPDG
jgi:hypothetical protein